MMIPNNSISEAIKKLECNKSVGPDCVYLCRSYQNVPCIRDCMFRFYLLWFTKWLF